MKRHPSVRFIQALAIAAACWLSSGTLSLAGDLPRLADERPWAAAEHPGVKLPAQELTGQLVYELLLAEIAAQRDHFGVAVDTYLQLARSTHDPRVAHRATEVALYAHDLKAAQEAIGLWLTEDPGSNGAREALASIILSQPKMPDVGDQLAALLADDNTDRARDFRNINIIFMQHPDHEGALALSRRLAEPYPQLPEAHYLVGSAAFVAGQNELALTEAREASRLKPGWEASALLEARVLQGQDSAQARSFYQDFLEHYPQARDFRLLYARYLVELKDYRGAREQFNVILKEAPQNPDLTLAVALLTLQLKDYAAATPLFEKALELGYRDPDAIRFYLGEAYEEQKKWAEAAQWYGAVAAGEQLTAARIRVALMWARQNQLKKALEMVRAVPVNTPEQREQRVLAEEQMLREAGDYQGAFDTLTAALRRMPDSADLLYERAIVSDKLNRMDVLEQDLRRVIVLRPEYAHAYNALGYSLADRSVRLDEALSLIQKAESLAPDDPFIMDSLGWVQFRMGHIQDAITTLKRAYAAQDDPEIAAHLGEVLWVSGDQTGALKTWEKSLKANPDNEALQATMHRFLH
ncbi:MAG: tetratricopeptide repeat protein [Betaproteobacteria bacterium]|nr:tetratricopeptide repeat protein [Betaproteobacteria bacterium]